MRSCFIAVHAVEANEVARNTFAEAFCKLITALPGASWVNLPEKLVVPQFEYLHGVDFTTVRFRAPQTEIRHSARGRVRPGADWPLRNCLS